ncbi:unnamed protein product [Arabidopsis lyrata]|nr:unnamed protein product [Arabidopsis lyrata]
MEEDDALILLLPLSLDIISQSPSSEEVQRRRILFILSSMLWLRRIMRSFCVHGGGEEGGDGHGGGQGLGLQSHLQPNKKPIHMPIKNLRSIFIIF